MKTDNRNVNALKSFLHEYFGVMRDRGSESETVESIRQGVEFKGANLWILIFAILMASLGLNINSTAVIIGAMLISPLMGPVMGIGLAVGINDFELLKRSLKSFLITTCISVIASTLFFILAPMVGQQSELLARTSPTMYDVFITLLGGLAGVVALYTKNRGTVLPGVAIVTALMPPLCTAGYGLATGNLIYFLGAFYLYFINSVFICVATFIGVRTLHFRRKTFVDKKRAKLVRRYIFLASLIAMAPAVYLTVGLIRGAVYDTAANRFIAEQLNFGNTQLIDKKVNYDKKEIKIVLLGSEVPDSYIDNARKKLNDYKLGGTKLTVMQGMNSDALNVESLRSMLATDYDRSNYGRLQVQRRQIIGLMEELHPYKTCDELSRNIAPELKVLYPSVKKISFSRALRSSVDSLHSDTVIYAVLDFENYPTPDEKKRITDWMKLRVKSDKIQVVCLDDAQIAKITKEKIHTIKKKKRR